MTLNEDIVTRIDNSKKLLKKAFEGLDPINYSKIYKEVWKARAEVEYVVVSLKLLNSNSISELFEDWKINLSKTLKQVRSDDKIREFFSETIESFDNLENINDIKDFYMQCWILKEKLTVLLNIVKPKPKITKSKDIE